MAFFSCHVGKYFLPCAETQGWLRCGGQHAHGNSWGRTGQALRGPVRPPAQGPAWEPRPGDLVRGTGRGSVTRVEGAVTRAEGAVTQGWGAVTRAEGAVLRTAAQTEDRS